MGLQERVDALTLEDKVRLLTGADAWSLHALPQIGLRRLVVSDGPVGVRGERWDERDTSANRPSPTAIAASWDERLVHRLGLLLAAEARRKGADVLLAPTVNLHRTPLGGRHFECYSEDPLLTARIGTAYVRGVHCCRRKLRITSRKCRGQRTSLPFCSHGFPGRSSAMLSAMSCSGWPSRAGEGTTDPALSVRARARLYVLGL